MSKKQMTQSNENFLSPGLSAEQRANYEKRAIERFVGEAIILARAREAVKSDIEFNYNFSPDDANAIINRLADIVVFLTKHSIQTLKKSLGKKPGRKKKELPDVGFDILEKALPEIETLYSAIKEIGFSGRIVDPEKKWKNAALQRYDERKGGFKFIKREYLVEKELYFLTQGQEKRDFQGRLAQKIMHDNNLGEFGIHRLKDIMNKLIIDTD